MLNWINRLEHLISLSLTHSLTTCLFNSIDLHVDFTDMTAIFEAFNDQEIACETPLVQNSGCQNNPDTQPIVTTIPGNNSVRLEWQAVGFASGYEVLRSDGGVHGCKQGKKLLTASSDGTNTGTTTTNLFYEDIGLQNGREVSDALCDDVLLC